MTIPLQLPNPPVKFTLAFIEATMCGSSAAALYINIDIFRPTLYSTPRYLVTFTFAHALRSCYSPSLKILLLHYSQIAFMGRDALFSLYHPHPITPSQRANAR